MWAPKELSNFWNFSNIVPYVYIYSDIFAELFMIQSVLYEMRINRQRILLY